jgi:HD-like signal output (HDOD) protein
MGSVSQILNDPKAGARKLGEAVSRDPTLCTRVLTMANSAYYRRRDRVHDVTRAVVMIGFAGISQLLRSSRL